MTTAAASRARNQRKLLDLKEPERSAWVGFLRTHAMLVRAMDADLQREHNLPLAAMDVLAQLMRAGGERQMSDLADAVLLSPSGCTRLVDRLEADGLVERRRGDRDSRVVIAAITTAGRRRLAEVLPTHLEGIRRRFVALLSDTELAELGRVFDRLLAGDEDSLAPSC
jgi:DNA-binding MarR family transcriptional regulator